MPQKKIQKSFELKIDEFAKAFEQDISLVLQQTSLKLFNAITLDTPVDTGRARASWNLTTDTVNLTVKPKEFKDPSYVDGSSGIRRFTPTYDTTKNIKIKKDVSHKTVFFISNNLKYIVPLERGHSAQNDRRGMVAINLRRIQRFLRESVENLRKL